MPNQHDGAIVYSHELSEEICQRLAEGETLHAICRDLSASDPTTPNIQPSTVRKWTRLFPDDFGARYDQAMVDGAEAMIDQMHEIAEHPTITELVTEKWSGGRKPMLLERTVRRVDSIERDKLRILVRQYRARMISPAVREKESKSIGLNGPGEGGAITVEIRGGLPSPNDPRNPVPIPAPEDPPAE